MGPNQCNQEKHFRCKSSGICIPISWHCDGKFNEFSSPFFQCFFPCFFFLSSCLYSSLSSGFLSFFEPFLFFSSFQQNFKSNFHKITISSKNFVKIHKLMNQKKKFQVQMIATIILTKRIVARFHVRRISTSATTPNAYSKHIFVVRLNIN